MGLFRAVHDYMLTRQRTRGFKIIVSVLLVLMVSAYFLPTSIEAFPSPVTRTRDRRNPGDGEPDRRRGCRG